LIKGVDLFQKLGNYVYSSSWVVPAGRKTPVPERDVRRRLFMIIVTKRKIEEKLEQATEYQFDLLQKQID
jgi:phenolic acid decarboxylase